MSAAVIDRPSQARGRPPKFVPPQSDSIRDALDQVFLQLDHVTALMEELEACRRSGARKAKPRHLVIFGASGSGKTRLLEKFAARYPDVVLPDRKFVRVLRASIPSSPTPRKIVRALLLALGSPFAGKGNDEEQMTHLHTLMNTCKVEIILFDEVSHLVDRGREKTHYRYGDALKEIVDALRRPFVLTGIPRLQKLFEVNEQLRGRFSRIRRIKPFSITTDQQVEQFRRVVKSFQNKLVGLDCIDLTSEEVLPRIYFATNGLLRPLVELLKEATEIATTNKSHRVDLGVLSEAFAGALWNDVPDHRNPFHTRFNTLALTADGEPYAVPERDR